jgi:hypothetical protein
MPRLEATNGSPTRLEPALALLLVYQDAGHTARFRQLLPAVEGIAELGRDPIELAVVRARRVAAEVMADPDRAAGLVDDAVRDAEVTKNPHQLAFAYLGRLAVAAVKADTALASDAFAQTRRWAEIATNRRVMDNDPLWMALATRNNHQPKEALALVREVLASFYDAGYWATLDFALNNILLPLVQLGHYRTAALALGAMTGRPDPHDTRDPTVRAKAALADALGSDLDHLLDEGRSLSSSALTRVILDDIDGCL